MIGTTDFAPIRVLQAPEYFVYCGACKMKKWGKICVQIAKGQFFAVTICAGLIPLDLLIALTVMARKPTEYCFIDAVWESGGNPEQPSIAVFGILTAISQRASRADWVYHALTGECSLIYPYLRINGLHFFCDACGKTT